MHLPLVALALLLVTPLTARAAAPVNDESIIWYTSKQTGELESAWIRATKSGYEVIATRPEVVFSDGQTLWLWQVIELRLTRSPLPTMPRTRGLGARVLMLGVEKPTTWGELLPKGIDAVRARFDEPPELLGSIGSELAYRRRGSEANPTLRTFDERIARTVSRGCHPSSPCTDIRARAALDDALAELTAQVEGRIADDDGPAPHAVVMALRERAAHGAMGFAQLTFEDAPAVPLRAAALATFSDRTTLATAVASPKALGLLSKANLQSFEATDASATLATFDRVVAEAPELGRGWLGRGHTKLVTGDRAGARADLTKGLALEQDRPFQRDGLFDLATIAEQEGDLPAAREQYRRAAEIESDDGPAHAKLAVLEVSSLQLDPTAEGGVRVDGFPAFSEDGDYFAEVFAGTTSDYFETHRSFTISAIIRRTRDDRVVFTFERATPEEKGAMPKAKLEAATKTITTALAKYGPWHRARSYYDIGQGEPTALDPATLVDFDGLDVSLDVPGAAKLFVRRVSVGKSIYNDGKPVRRGASPREDALQCDFGAEIGAIYTDVERRAGVVVFRHTDAGDLCDGVMPGDVTLAFRFPDDEQHVGWRERAREKSPRWLEEDYQDVQRRMQRGDGSDEASTNAELVELWGARYPNAPPVAKARAALE